MQMKLFDAITERLRQVGSHSAWAGITLIRNIGCLEALNPRLGLISNVR
jgi:hypothetical protein